MHAAHKDLQYDNLASFREPRSGLLLVFKTEACFLGKAGGSMMESKFILKFFMYQFKIQTYYFGR